MKPRNVSGDVCAKVSFIWRKILAGSSLICYFYGAIRSEIKRKTNKVYYFSFSEKKSFSSAKKIEVIW